jgi:hypothetical protein
VTATLRLPYKVRARLQPAAVTALPFALAILVWFPKGFEGRAAILSLLSWAGISGLVMTLARDRGRVIEPELWKAWGGAPTTRLLRFRDASNQAMLALRHKALGIIAPEIALPASAAAEAANRTAADGAYEACVSVLRSSTRDRKKFPLVFEENCDYGYRRNLLGLRPWGLVAVLVGLAAVAAHAWMEAEATPLEIAVTAIITLEAVFWLFLVRPDWVRRAADAYAARLLEAGAEIAAAHSAGASKS